MTKTSMRVIVTKSGIVDVKGTSLSQDVIESDEPKTFKRVIAKAIVDAGYGHFADETPKAETKPSKNVKET